MKRFALLFFLFAFPLIAMQSKQLLLREQFQKLQLDATDEEYEQWLVDLKKTGRRIHSFMRDWLFDRRMGSVDAMKCEFSIAKGQWNKIKRHIEERQSFTWKQPAITEEKIIGFSHAETELLLDIARKHTIKNNTTVEFNRDYPGVGQVISVDPNAYCVQFGKYFSCLSCTEKRLCALLAFTRLKRGVADWQAGISKEVSKKGTLAVQEIEQKKSWKNYCRIMSLETECTVALRGEINGELETFCRNLQVQNDDWHPSKDERYNLICKISRLKQLE